MRARRSVFSPPLYRQLVPKTPEQGFALRALFRVGIKLSPYGIGQWFFAVSMVNTDRNQSGKPARSDWFTETRLHPGEHMSSPERAVPQIDDSAPAGNETVWEDQDTSLRKPPQSFFQPAITARQRYNETNAAGAFIVDRKKPVRSVPTEDKLLVGREEAASMLSISCRALDYLVANKQLSTRRIGARVLIPISDLRRFSRGDHPEPLAG
jgi:hypothetical protein